MPCKEMLDSILNLDKCFICNNEIVKTSESNNLIYKQIDPIYIKCINPEIDHIHFSVGILNNEYWSFIIKLNDNVCVFRVNDAEDRYYIYGLTEQEIFLEASNIKELYEKGLKIVENILYLS